MDMPEEGRKTARFGAALEQSKKGLSHAKAGGASHQLWAVRLRGEFGPVRASRLRDALVVGQVVVCLVLLICAGVLLRGARRMLSIDSGYEARGVYSFWSNAANVVPEALGVSKLFASFFAGKIDVFDGMAYAAG
jgi:hypothetical protein